jgi:hypothetical protein
MAGSTIKITIDRQKRAIVSFRGSIPSLTGFYQADTFTAQVQVVDSAATQLQDATVVDAGGLGFGLDLWIGPTPVGNASQVAYVFQNVWTWDAVNKWFTADIAMNTAGVAAALGANSSVSSDIEFHLTLAGNSTTIYESTVPIFASGDKAGASAPTGDGNTYLTKAQILALLQSKVDIFSKSPGNVYARTIGGVDDAGNPQDAITKL